MGVEARRGPRRGEDTRAAILEAARVEFARTGYAGTSLRAVARAAGVDPALVHHYFEGKDDLFAQSVVLVSLPGRPASLVSQVTEGPREEVGLRAVRTFLGVWEARRSSFEALLRSIVTSEEVSRAVREFLTQEIFGQVVAGLEPGLGPEERDLRAGLAAAAAMGLAMGRYVVRLPGVADADPETLVQRVGPVLQGYLLPR
ncbi:TetR family transcriptional regulator [uncultured Serinicoccus sp.]|uniref:TetR/AcrR family transcriptional regulator n=1 Tax=uncultured Serinicoccus sp. TaxID=735514 RepID=UPI002626C9E9|nr:TetR family transcriptional regulator [uncultured Serinicoccus sp.]